MKNNRRKPGKKEEKQNVRKDETDYWMYNFLVPHDWNNQPENEFHNP